MLKFLNIIFLLLLAAIFSLYLTKRTYIYLHEYFARDGIFLSVEDKNTSTVIGAFLENNVKNLSDSDLEISFSKMKGFCLNSNDMMPSKLSKLYNIKSFQINRIDKYFSKFDGTKDYLLLIKEDSSVIPVFFNKKSAEFQFSSNILKNRIKPDEGCFWAESFEMKFKQSDSTKKVQVFIK